MPVIDLAGTHHEVADAVDEACCRVGFFQIVDHGVPTHVIEAMREATAGFFALPAHEKRRWLPPDPSVNRGYAAEGSEALSYSLGRHAPPDLFEAFNVGPDDVPDEVMAYPAAPNFFPRNVWPEGLDEFRAAVSAYFIAVRALSHELTSLFATALGLPADHFVPFTDHSTDVMRIVNYERRAGQPPPRPGQLRMGPHTDYGIVTVLYADPVPGLEIADTVGGWHPIVAADGALVVNLGDLLAKWTNDRWRSTLHRVVPPPGDGPARRRSVAFFHDGNHDALIECLQTCTSADNPPRYPPVLAGEHLLAKVIGPRTMTPSSATSTAADRMR